MSISTSRTEMARKAVSSNRNFVLTLLAGVFMIVLARFVLDGTLAGMFGVWGISLVAAGVGGYLLLYLWSAYN
ncbi:hypothetical protein ACFQJC_06475 [Haloferax namakaokahaiae]|uniref:Uncharacterized protein n=1 Tax=Haloferax namakaokahaiae TaxID=1748331 RepID=A0ABD5ZD10_9EURY